MVKPTIESAITLEKFRWLLFHLPTETLFQKAVKPGENSSTVLFLNQIQAI